MNGSPYWAYIGLSLLLIPLLVALVDCAAGIRAKHSCANVVSGQTRDDFNVLVPIYGSISFLENSEYLAPYGDRVILCTTTSESPLFNSDLREIADRHNFRVFYGDCDTRTASASKRQTGGTTRDRLVRDALTTVRQPWVVCVDADTVTDRPLGELIGSASSYGFDMVSVRLEPSNTSGWLARLQAHEYRLAMSVRRVVPWLVSGACHAGRTEVLAHIMRRHSLFFQGNDVETGLLAQELGYRVGHLPFVVPTTVPSTARSWFRQRYAWSGGEFRLFIVNFKLIRRHPLLWFYGAVIMYAGTFLRWYTTISVPLSLAGVFVVYVALLTYVNWRTRDWYLLAMPLYAAVTSFIMVPLALTSYLRMAWSARNLGVILAKTS